MFLALDNFYPRCVDLINRYYITDTTHIKYMRCCQFKTTLRHHVSTYHFGAFGLSLVRADSSSASYRTLLQNQPTTKSTNEKYDTLGIIILQMA